MKSNTKKIIALIILGIGFVFLPNIKLNFSVDQKTNLSILKESGVYSEPFIHIDGSIPGNWSDTVSDYLWCAGSGTWNDPYIIENVSIDASSSPTGSGIFINNSKNDYFMIRNCTVYNAVSGLNNAGIKLENTCNGTLIDNNCSNNACGGILLVTNCKNNTISGNTVSLNYIGIYLSSNCDRNTLSGNTANNNDNTGIYLEIYCDNNTLSGNTANLNWYGITLNSNCSRNTLSGNTANYNNEDGITLNSYCSRNTLSGNTANDNDNCGILLSYCDNNTILGNTANDNDNYGIYLEINCDNNIISGNTAYDNYYHGIYLWFDCDNNTISGNTASLNDYGIYLENRCDNNTLSGNTANNNDDTGIYLWFYCDNNTISGNTANNNDDTGIYLWNYCDNNTITVNVLYNNTQGIEISTINCNNNSIYKNFFLENEKHAVDYGTDNKWNSTTIGNYWDNWTSPDVNNDGIVDVPYNISLSPLIQDHLPIAEDGAPRITIDSPSTGDYFGSDAPSFEVTITDVYVFSRWYTIDGGVHNYTFTENGMINQSMWDEMDDGTITLTFYASDIVYQYFNNISHIGSADVDIIKDTVAPIIIINSPAEGDRFGTNAPLFNITVTDDNLDTIWYSFDGGLTTYAITNNTMLNQTAWAALTQGNVTITFYANDLAGNEASESVTVIKSIPSGLDPAVIITIIIVSIVGGVVVISIVYIFMKKRAVPA